MPCWYYDKKELRNTPSAREGIEWTTEARYRKEGARFIIDCGTKLGLRYESCATGVVFFHRFYMFHSFKEFHRYVTAACCLFLAGKTEETPKKCKDIMKTTRTMLTDAQFSVFGDDPKEEVMTMERILLQTIKFDLMVEHPYAYLLKFAKMLKGKGSDADKAKVQKLVQMAWTFINDSLCTMLCLQWEPDVIAVSLMYLATRLNKSDVTDWLGKPAGFKGKWWESLVEDVNQELLEDVCHQVLDLYQPTPAAKSTRDDTPPPPPPKPGASSAPSTKSKRNRSPAPNETGRSAGPTPSKVPREDKRPSSPISRSSSKDRDRSSKHSSSRSASSAPSSKTSRQSSNSSSVATPSAVPTVTTTSATSYSQNNPYMSQNMYSSSFMSQEGSQSIQSLVGGRATYGGYTQPPPTQTPVTPIVAPTPTTTTYSQPSTYPQSSYQAPAYQQPPPNYQQPPPTATAYAQSSTYSQSYNYPPPQQPYTMSNPQYQTPQQPPLQSYGQNYTGSQTHFTTSQQYQSNYQYSTQNFPAQSYQAPRPTQPPPPAPQPLMSVPRTTTNTGIPPVRIMGRLP